MSATDTDVDLAGQLATLQEKYDRLKSQVDFLYYWMIRGDENVRDLIAAVGGLPEARAHNDAAFEHKWTALGEGTSSLANPEHRAELPDVACRWTGLDAGWFRGQRVLDAGCGDGRLSWAMASLGAEVTSVDVTEKAIERVTAACAEFPSHRAFRWDLLEPFEDDARYDLVLSFGVVHCSGDTQRAIDNLAAVVAPGGHLALMVYGYPRIDHPADFDYMCTKERRRQAIRHMEFDEARAFLRDELGDDMAVRGWFDATTPRVEEHFTYPQLARMVERTGLTDLVRIAPEIRNLCIRATRPVE